MNEWQENALEKRFIDSYTSKMKDLTDAFIKMQYPFIAGPTEPTQEELDEAKAGLESWLS